MKSFSLRAALLVLGILCSSVLAQGVGLQQCSPGMVVTKVCPPSVSTGAQFMCTFTVGNLDPTNTVNSLVVTNTVPFPGGTPVSLLCTQGGIPVTVLGPFGSATDSCAGVVEETAPPCTGGAFVLTDQVAAVFVDPCQEAPVTGAASASVNVLCPPPTPTNTPTRTPTSTPTNVPTNTPTNTPTNVPTSTPTTSPTLVVVVPTLNGSVTFAFGLLIAAAGLLLLIRRR